MVVTLAAFRERLDGTWLRGRRAVALAVPESIQPAFAVELGANELDRFWPTAAELARASGLWPIVTASYPRDGGWLDAVSDEDFFNRFEYEQEIDDGEISPAAVLRAAEGTEVAAFLLQLEIQRRLAENELEAFVSEPGRQVQWQAAIDTAIEDCRLEFGDAPTKNSVLAALGPERGSDHHAIERFMLHWEMDRGYRRDPCDAVPTWFDPGPGHVTLLFLAINCSWDALAYLHWFGADSRRRSANVIALGRHWQRQHGAELVAHFGTMLQCTVARPPDSLRAAWVLACEHDLLSPGTLAPSGTRLRHYALGLIGCQRWFLHERP